MSITKAAEEFYTANQNLKARDIIDGVKLSIPDILVGKNKPRLDAINREVKPGDLVAYSINSRSVYVAVVVGFTPEGFRLMSFDRYDGSLYQGVFSQPVVVLVHSS